MIDFDTFGKTPAAHYLARILNDGATKNTLSAVGKRITATSNQVADLVNAYEKNSIGTKTFANCLRLMREEVTNAKPIENCDPIINQLCKNVQIGYIKRAMRTSKIARKSEVLMRRKDSLIKKYNENTVQYFYRDAESKEEIFAGFTVNIDPDFLLRCHRPRLEEYQTTNPDTLYQKSFGRIARQNKIFTN